jgi:hypothetical protein
MIVKARLDRRTYKRGIKVSKREIQALNLQPHEFHGEWNYTITPSDIDWRSPAFSLPDGRKSCSRTLA